MSENSSNQTSKASNRKKSSKSRTKKPARQARVPSVKVKYTDVALAPSYATEGSAAFDVRSSRKIELQPAEVVRVPTGLFFEIPKGFFCQICSRSGISYNAGIRVLHGVGVIDSDYRGEIYVTLENRSLNRYTINRGDRIAQGIILPAPQVKFVPVKELNETDRGDGGYGSTGS